MRNKRGTYWDADSKWQRKERKKVTWPKFLSLLATFFSLVSWMVEPSTAIENCISTLKQDVFKKTQLHKSQQSGINFIVKCHSQYHKVIDLGNCVHKMQKKVTLKKVENRKKAANIRNLHNFSLLHQFYHEDYAIFSQCTWTDKVVLLNMHCSISVVRLSIVYNITSCTSLEFYKPLIQR